jgi:hypothetical protein
MKRKNNVFPKLETLIINFKKNVFEYEFLQEIIEVILTKIKKLNYLQIILGMINSIEENKIKLSKKNIA